MLRVAVFFPLCSPEIKRNLLMHVVELDMPQYVTNVLMEKAIKSDVMIFFNKPTNQAIRFIIARYSSRLVHASSIHSVLNQVNRTTIMFHTTITIVRHHLIYISHSCFSSSVLASITLVQVTLEAFKAFAD